MSLLLPLIININLFSRISILIGYLFIVIFLFIIPFILFMICYRHDKYIKLIVEDNENISYFESDELLFKFKLDDIESITIYSAPRYFHEFYSLNLKNKITVYISYLTEINLIYKLKSNIEKEIIQCIVFEELWNPIYKVENQLRLLNKDNL